MNLVLDRETNPKYFEVVEKGFNDLMDRWNSLNKKIHDVKVPTVFPFLIKSDLNEIKDELKNYKKTFYHGTRKLEIFL